MRKYLTVPTASCKQAPWGARGDCGQACTKPKLYTAAPRSGQRDDLSGNAKLELISWSKDVLEVPVYSREGTKLAGIPLAVLPELHPCLSSLSVEGMAGGRRGHGGCAAEGLQNAVGLSGSLAESCRSPESLSVA